MNKRESVRYQIAGIAEDGYDKERHGPAAFLIYYVLVWTLIVLPYAAVAGVLILVGYVVSLLFG